MTALLSLNVWAQRTVGVIDMVDSLVYPGYNLFMPHNQTNAYLLDNCGRIVNQWNDNVYRPGNSAELSKDGKLVRTGSQGAASNQWIHAGGGGEVLQIKSWDDQLLWQWAYSDSVHRLHHDFALLDNGNILAIAWERFVYDDCVAAGRDTNLLVEGEVWAEVIVEVEPVGTDSGKIVWEWHAWDHVIQDYDSTKANYGDPGLAEGKIDLNYVGSSDGEADWLHFNAIDFNPFLNQIVLSVPTFNEVWIIDHSTSMAEAATSSGGLAGRGGEILYRWGNPMAYRRSDSTGIQLVFQHDVHWIDQHLNASHPDFGKLMIFNNRIGGDYSEVCIIAPLFDSYNWEYTMTATQYPPFVPSWIYQAPNPTDFYSSGLAGAQRLANGNTLICSGRQGWTFEIDQNEDIVWEYRNPLIQGSAVSQGDNIIPNSNNHFRFNRYPLDFEGFAGKDMIPGAYIELNPDTMLCFNSTVSIEEESLSFEVFPNPAQKFVNINTSIEIKPSDIRLIDLSGRQVSVEIVVAENGWTLDVQALKSGLYVLQIASQSEQLLIQH